MSALLAEAPDALCGVCGGEMEILAAGTRCWHCDRLCDPRRCDHCRSEIDRLREIETMFTGPAPWMVVP